MVFIGTISYGFYLYQEAVMNGVRSMAGHSVSLRTLCVPDFIATALVAALSFYAVEKPVMRRAKVWLSRTTARLPAAPATRTAIEVAAMELKQS
jgi:peptidoglycan/LPS O-acetylase OafA/YrhL